MKLTRIGKRSETVLVDSENFSLNTVLSGQSCCALKLNSLTDNSIYELRFKDAKEARFIAERLLMAAASMDS